VQVIELTDPRSPALLGTVDVPNHELAHATLTREVGVFGTLHWPYENLVFDFSDPWNPYLKSSFGHGDPVRIRDRLCLARTESGIHLIDLGDLSAPAHLSSFEFGRQLWSADLYDGHVYAITDSETASRDLHVLDVQDPAAPELLTMIPRDSHAGSMAFNGDRFFLYGHQVAWIFDITDPANPVLDGSFPAHGHTGRGMAFHGNVVTYSGWLVTRRDDGMDITDVPDGGALAACRLAFAVDRARDLAVTIHDVRGRHVAEVARGVFQPGRHAVTWHGQDHQGRALASGVYLVRLHGPGVEASQLVTLVK
jgi:hypothetical protein